MFVPLDHYCAAVGVQFLEAVTQWHGLKFVYCGFVYLLIHFLRINCWLFWLSHYVFFMFLVSTFMDKMIVNCIHRNKGGFILVKLGRKTTSNG
ncbi:hypothetical protein BhenCHDE101_08470 [Bartonella henselae]|nr:hypothetical protein BhenCHDE101_08470 [Bartonella henselae]